MKKISTKTHGMLDYASAFGMLVLPRLMRWNPAITRLLTGSAVLTTLYSLLTRYELGAVKTLPMKTHLKLDAGQSLALASAPFLFSNVRKSTTVWLLALSLFEALVTLNSERRPRRRFLGFRF